MTGAPRHVAPAAVVAVVGPGECDPDCARDAEEVGRLLAEAACLLVCGGLGGVMAAACRGARSAGGTTVGLLPGPSRHEANPDVTVPIATGLGELRNALVVRAADVVVAVGAGYGTLSEVALALKLGRPVVGLRTWGLVRPDGTPDGAVVVARGPGEAVARALALAGRRAPDAAPTEPPV